MNICILNGNPDPQNFPFEEYLTEASRILSKNHQVTILTLRELDLRFCIGCFGCWVKTPGECVTPDDGPQVCRTMIQSDFTLWAAPIRMGYPSTLLKKVMDKSIPLIHPYFTVDQNEAHHRTRYARYPRLGLLLEKETGTDSADLEIIALMFRRTAINMKSHLAFCRSTDQPVDELAQAILSAESPFPRQVPRLLPTRGMQIAPLSRLTIFNGSPRGRKGNTPILLDQFARGFASSGDNRVVETFHLNRLQESGSHVQAFGASQGVLLGFPLYTDAMPGIVKSFIEQLEPLCSREANPPLGFLVQSGFPEAGHSRYVERYLEKLAARLGSPYLGTLVKGGAEGVRLMPDSMNASLFDTLQQIGRQFGQSGQFNPLLLQNLAKPEHYPTYLVPLYRLLSRTPLLSFYWDGLLRKNGAFDRRFARPYTGQA